MIVKKTCRKRFTSEMRMAKMKVYASAAIVEDVSHEKGVGGLSGAETLVQLRSGGLLQWLVTVNLNAGAKCRKKKCSGCELMKGATVGRAREVCGVRVKDYELLELL